MGQTPWFRERRAEHYHRKAKMEGYRARSAYKLKEIDERFHLFKKSNTVVDMGAAPGGWSQVALELVGESGVVVGGDLERVRPIAGAVFLQGEMTSPATVHELLAMLKERGRAEVDVVVSDMSPSLTGTYSMDQANSYWLAAHALAFAGQVLRKGGHFVAKIFEGEDTPAFEEALKASFFEVRRLAPLASRKQSSEVYFIAKFYKGKPPTGPA
jgi:23S rRNA (uridine2552-2'-O)-methyltransferase